MITRKRKKHRIYDLLKYMHMLEDGYSFNYIEDKFGIDARQLKVLWSRYRTEGNKGLEKRPNIRADYALKRIIVLDIEENHITLHAASLKYGASTSRIKVWLKIARTEGIEALRKLKKRGRPLGMGRPKKNSKPLTELERLKLENEDLRLEIALLKKVRALVEKREARLRAIGREPSKN